MLLITAVAVAQLVESWIVIPVVVGSSPIGHPKIPLLFKALQALQFPRSGNFPAKNQIFPLIRLTMRVLRDDGRSVCASSQGSHVRRKRTSRLRGFAASQR